MTTNYHSPFAIVRFGDVGHKFAWIVSTDTEGNFKGHSAKGHFSKATKPGKTEFYKTLRTYKKEDVIATWRNMPSLAAIKHAIKKAKEDEKIKTPCNMFLPSFDATIKCVHCGFQESEHLTNTDKK